MPQPKNSPQSDDVELVSMDLPLDRETVSWLSRMARNDAEAAEMVASMLKMIREDDESASATLH